MKHISHFTKIILNEIKTKYDKQSSDGVSANTKRDIQNRKNAKLGK